MISNSSPFFWYVSTLFLCSITLSASIWELYNDFTQLYNVVFALVTFMHGGSPCGTEIDFLNIKNAAIASRSIYAMSGYLAIVTSYNKTWYNMHRDKVITCWPMHEVSRFCISWFSLDLWYAFLLLKSLRRKKPLNITSTYGFSMDNQWTPRSSLRFLVTLQRRY